MEAASAHGKRSFSSGNPHEGRIRWIRGCGSPLGAPAGLRDHHRPGRAGAPRGPLAPANTLLRVGAGARGDPARWGPGFRTWATPATRTRPCSASATPRPGSLPAVRAALGGLRAAGVLRPVRPAGSRDPGPPAPRGVIVPEGELLTGFHATAHEFLLFTLDALQRACVPEERPPSPPGRPSQEDATLIRRVFGGHWRSRIPGVSAPWTLTGHRPGHPGGAGVTQALELLVRPERLGGAERLPVRQVPPEVPAPRRCALLAASRVLTLVRSGFLALADSKVERDVRYPEAPGPAALPVQGRRAGPAAVRLYAVCWSTRAAPATAATTSAVRTAGGRWFKMDDAQTSELEGGQWETHMPRDRAQGRGLSTQRGPESAPNFRVPGPGARARGAGQATSFRAAATAPGASRPKPQSNLREVARAVPAEAVLFTSPGTEGARPTPAQPSSRGVLPGGQRALAKALVQRGSQGEQEEEEKKQGHRFRARVPVMQQQEWPGAWGRASG
ncbi:LOW QUALITY PROTEIN: hypothetical protein QTO34_001674 [Cnephaeus nilssonii]|uniref:Uncharacterized protein n=1 Tax=Cnephaeus nilssonii TaxID=3371016 RepID=A0AA40HA51_CNENI|nr:LOW QUALITY PROTEIN: hypothetical protein QTO34_001674 [Eptesicus nilssonii]